MRCGMVRINIGIPRQHRDGRAVATLACAIVRPAAGGGSDGLSLRQVINMKRLDAKVDGNAKRTDAMLGVP